MSECRQREWWSRWNGHCWELVTAGTPGAVEDLIRLAAFRQGHQVEDDDRWRQLLELKRLQHPG